MNRWMLSAMIGLTIGCAITSTPATTQSNASVKDGELAFPSNYRAFPVFLTNIQKPDAVREIYINERGAQVHQGESFPFGTILVMEIYDVDKDAEGHPVKRADGMLTKSDLKKIYVMQKDRGWGNHVSPELRTGNWVYAVFTSDGTPLDVDYAQCRGCHQPLGDAKDYVHRYDEYFATRHHAH